jgi:cytidylate kinase
MDNFIVAIDGTAASGKSTTARGVAKALGFLYLDTGAMYRAVTYKIVQEKLDIKKMPVLIELLARTTIEFRKSVDGKNLLFLDGTDVTRQIRMPEIDAMVSPVSAIPEVREKMVAEQHHIAQDKNIVVEGRDIGSVVFPDADIKFYLDCSLDERTIRRERQLHRKDKGVSANTIKTNLAQRDHIDSSRETSPLMRVPDAIYIDTTNLTINQEIQFVVNKIQEKLNSRDRDNK